MKRKGMGQVCCIGHTDSRSEQLMLQKIFHHHPGKQSISVHIYTKYTSSVPRSLCSLTSSSLPYLVIFSTTDIIYSVGRGPGGTRASAVVVTAICSNPVQGLKVEQHDVILVIDCVSQLFLMSVNLEDWSIATIPLFRVIKTIFIANSTRTAVLCTQGSTAAKPVSTFSCKVQTDQVTYSNITMASCTDDLEHIFAAAVPLISPHVQPRTCTVNTGNGTRCWAT